MSELRLNTVTDKDTGKGVNVDALHYQNTQLIRNLGSWQPGLVFEDKTDYATHNNQAIVPKEDTTLPYTTQGSDPTDGPDEGLVIPFAEVTRSDVVVNVASISELLTVQSTGDGSKINVTAYHDGWAATNEEHKGGGVFVWGSGRHNGGTFIDPARPFPRDWDDQSQLEAWFADSGSDTSGWKREYSGSVSITWFGAVGDGVTNDSEAFQRCIKHVEHTGGGTVTGPARDYAANMVIKEGNVSLIFDPGTIIRAATNRQIIATGYDAKNITIKNIEARGQTKEQEDAVLSDVTALHGFDIRSVDTHLFNVKAFGFRQDSLYVRTRTENHEWSNIYIENFDFGDTSRNTVSIITGMGIHFKNGRVWNKGDYTSSYGSSLYLFDIEPNHIEGSKISDVFCDNIRFESGSPVSGANRVILTNIFPDADSPRFLNVHFDNCRFGKLNGEGKPAAIRGRGQGEATKGLFVRNCIFEGRVIVNDSDTYWLYEDCVFENITFGAREFTYWGIIGDNSTLSNVRSSDSLDPISVTGYRDNKVTTTNVQGIPDTSPGDTLIRGSSRTTGGDITKVVQGDGNVNGGTMVSVVKRLVIDHGTYGLPVLTIAGVDYGRVAQVWEVTVNTQATGSTQSYHQRSQKVAFMVTSAYDGIPVVDVITGYGWGETQSSAPSGGDRWPGKLNLEVTVNGDNEVEVSMDVTNSKESGENVISVFAVGTGRRLNEEYVT